MAESISSRSLVGLFLKKSDKRKEDNPAVDKKKKKHKRVYSVRLIKAWKADKCESEIEPSRTGKESNRASRKTVDATVSNEKEKPKNLRRRLPFGRPESLEQKELNSPEDTCGVILEEPASLESLQSNELLESNEHQGDSEEIEITELEDEGEEESSQGDMPEAPTEDEVKEALLEMAAEAGVSPEDLIPEVASESGSSTTDTCQEENPAIVPNPEEQSGDFEEKISPLKELVFNEERASQVDAISSNSQCEVCLYVYDLSLGNLIGCWSFVVGLARDATKQVFLYFISSLIKRYPQCFKVQVKKRKRRNQKPKPKPKEVTFSDII